MRYAIPAALAVASLLAVPADTRAQILPQPPSPNVIPSPDAQSYPGCTDSAGKTICSDVLQVVDIRAYGAKCDGTADDTVAIQSAATSLTTGGTVFIPATGHTCKVAGGITLPVNVSLKGVGFHHWSGSTATDPEIYASSGSWIKCSSTTSSCVTINNVGNIIDGVNFIYAQPAPVTNWAPTIYPYTINITGSANFTILRNIAIVAGTHCINWDGASTGISGIYSSMENIVFDGCYNVGTRFSNIDNTMRVSHLRYVNWWNANQPGIIPYIEANKVDWVLNYIANLQGDDVEFYQSKVSMQATNSTINSGDGPRTYAAVELQLSNVSFNEVCQAISFPNGNGTIFSGAFSNVIAYGDTNTNCFSGKAMFDLSSDQADVTLSTLRGGFMDKVANIGRGLGGSLKVLGSDVQKYAAVTSGTTAFGVSANTSFTLASTPYRNIRPNSGAGALIGPGVDGSQGYVEPTQVGACGTTTAPGEGCTNIRGSSDTVHSGYVEYFMPNGTRAGYTGFSVAGEINLQSDAGTINLLPSNGANQMKVGSAGGNLILNVANLPISCTGRVTGDLWNNAGAVQICP